MLQHCPPQHYELARCHATCPVVLMKPHRRLELQCSRQHFQDYHPSVSDKSRAGNNLQSFEDCARKTVRILKRLLDVVH